MKTIRMKITILGLIGLWLGYKKIQQLDKKEVRFYPDWLNNFYERKAVR